MRDKLKRFLSLPYPIFVFLFLAGAIVSVLALRANNQKMIELRTAVYQADQAGVGIDEALDKLRTYVYGHMNTNLASGGNAIKPPIQLKYTYDRLVAAEEAKAEVSNSKIYTDAQEYCQAQIPAGTSGIGRVPCVQEYVSSRGVQIKEIPPGLYQFDFLSPSWSPDLAGWGLVFTVTTLALSVVSFFKQRPHRS